MPPAEPAAPPPLRVVGLDAGYPGRRVLRDVALSVAAGEIRCIIGASGSGKTTLMRHIIGLIPPAAGTVEILGQDLFAAAAGERADILGQVGVVFQNGALLSNLNVLENVALPLRRRTRLSDPLCEAVARLKLRQLGMDHALAQPPHALSGGMQKRVALARALALDPPLLVCDEPSAGLDPITAAGLDQLLLDQRDRFGTSILVVTHELHSVRTIADTLTVVGEGGVVADGPRDVVEGSDDRHVRALLRREPEPRGGGSRSLLDLLSPDPVPPPARQS